MRLIAWLPLVSLALPLGVSAATPQQIFGKSIDETFRKGAPLRVDAKMNAKYVETSSGKAVKGEVDARLMLRYRQERSGAQDSEGRFVLEKLKAEGETSLLPQTLEGPLAVEWKRIGLTTYLRLKTGKLPTEVEQQLGPDVVKLLGQWLFVESTEAKQATQELEVQAKENIPIKVGVVDFSSSFTAELKKLQVMKVEKIEKRKNGDLVYRLRLRINPAEIAKAEKLRLAEIAKMTDAAAMKSALDAAKKDFAGQREEAKHVWFAATVNATQNALERLEISGWTVEDQAATKTAAASKKRTDIKFGISLWRNGDWTVEKPANSLDLKEVIGNLMAKAMQGATIETQPAVQPSAPAVGLTQEFIETTVGYKVGYPSDWYSQVEGNDLTLTAKYKEDGLPPEMAVWSYDAVDGVDADKMIDSVIGQVRDKLLLNAIEKDGWIYTLTAPEATTANDTLGSVVPGKSYLMTRNTDLGVVVTRIAIYPNAAGDKYLAVMFNEPLMPSAGLEKLRDAMWDSFTLVKLTP